MDRHGDIARAGFLTFHDGIFMHTQQTRGQLLRDLHLAAKTFLMPNAWDGGSARMLASYGFPAIATTSAGIAFSLGLPDYAGARRLFIRARRGRSEGDCAVGQGDRRSVDGGDGAEGRELDGGPAGGASSQTKGHVRAAPAQPALAPVYAST
jgi:hypothetical protein